MSDPTPMLAILGCGGAVWLLAKLCGAPLMSGRKVQAHVHHLLERGAAIEYKGWHCYRSKRNKYVVMQYDANGCYKYQTEREFAFPAEAAKAFLANIKELERGPVAASDE